jgi:hypothetical protein
LSRRNDNHKKPQQPQMASGTDGERLASLATPPPIPLMSITDRSWKT